MRCAVEPYDPYEHQQSIVWTRLDAAFSLGLGKGWQADVNVPVDLRFVSVSYTDLGGDPIDPPSDIHHRDETIAGVSDGALRMWRFGDVKAWTFGVGLGTSLPLGTTVPDPFALTEQGRDHEHMQLGSGTFDPLAGAAVVVRKGHTGGLLQAMARLPVYENRHGYQGPANVDTTLALSYRFKPWFTLVAGPAVVAEGPDRWAGEPHGGRIALLGEVGALFPVDKTWTIQASGRVSLYQHDAPSDEEGTLRQPFVASAAVAWSPPKKKKEPEKQAN